MQSTASGATTSGWRRRKTRAAAAPTWRSAAAGRPPPARAWRGALTAYVLACAAVFLDYWTQWTGRFTGIEDTLFAAGWVVTVPGFLLTLLCSTVLGVTLLVRRFRPTLPAVLLALTLPAAVIILMGASMGSAALPVMFAFGLLGRRIA